MATPSDKSLDMERFIKDFFGIDRREVIRSNKCVECGGDALEFDDELSRKEYTISGLCQQCQNNVFGK